MARTRLTERVREGLRRLRRGPDRSAAADRDRRRPRTGRTGPRRTDHIRPTGTGASDQDEAIAAADGTAAGRGPDGITVAYAPEIDGDPDPGEVCWTWVPYEEDPSQGKDRPVLVLGFDGDQLAVVPLSSKSHDRRDDAAEWVPVGTGAWDPQSRPSHADASRLIRVPVSAVRREGSALDRGRFDAVLARVSQLHPWRPADP